MKCIIVDDEKIARVIIQTLAKEIKGLHIVEEFSSAIEAIKFLNENIIDLIFLDIHMPDFSGLDFIKSLKNPPKIILTTSDSKFAIEAFEYDFIIDYLLKPLALTRFQKAVTKAENKNIATASSSLKVKDTSNDFYVKNYIVHSTLKKIEEKLPDSLFLKIHRSFIINIKKIIDIEDNSVLIKKDVIPVSRSKRPELMKRLDLL